MARHSQLWIQVFHVMYTLFYLNVELGTRTSFHCALQEVDAEFPGCELKDVIRKTGNNTLS